MPTKLRNSLLIPATVCLTMISNAESQFISSSGSPDYHFLNIVNGDTTSFFPIGWYFESGSPNPLSDNLQKARNFGANVCLVYHHSVWNRYGSGDYTYEAYKNSMDRYLADLPDGMMAIIDLKVRTDMKSSTDSLRLALVSQYRQAKNIFGWYIADEPYAAFAKYGEPTPAQLSRLAKSIRQLDNKHPILLVVLDDRFQEEFSRDAFDILMRDRYVFSAGIDSNKIADRPEGIPWRDYNEVSRIATARGMKQVIGDPDDPRDDKWGHIFVAMAHDRYIGETVWDNLRRMTTAEIVYQSMSPIIHGSRGLIYYWWNALEANLTTIDTINQFIRFFTNDDGYDLDRILLEGENRDKLILLDNFKIDSVAKKPIDYTWGNYHNYYNDSRYLPPPGDLDFVQFNYLVRKYNSSYYLFAVNDHRSLVETDFVLGNMLDVNEFVYRIIEFGPFDQEAVINFIPDPMTNGSRFGALFESYEVKFYRIDVIAWPVSY